MAEREGVFEFAFRLFTACRRDSLSPSGIYWFSRKPTFRRFRLSALFFRFFWCDGTRNGTCSNRLRALVCESSQDSHLAVGGGRKRVRLSGSIDYMTRSSPKATESKDTVLDWRMSRQIGAQTER